MYPPPSPPGGFIFGLVAAVVFLPYITFGKWDRRRKRLLLVIGFLLLCVLFGLLLGAFYLQKNNFCPWCHYFDCIPWSKDFCQVELNTWDGTL
jgi:multisubunit Na+/H+ antiporter MnhB subunit